MRCVFGISLVAATGLVLAACQQTPAGGGTPATGQNAVFSVTVNPVGPATWTYTVKDLTGAGGINQIELISAINPRDCSVTPPANWTRNTARGTNIVLDPRGVGLTTATVSLTCDKVDGPGYVRAVHTVSGATVVGPVSAPN